MRSMPRTTGWLLGVLILGWLLAGCGDDGDSSRDTVIQVPTVTAPEITTQTQPIPDASPPDAVTTTTTPTGGSTSPSPAGQSSGRGGSPPAKQTKAERRRQRACEKQVAGLPTAQRREALSDCLNPAPPASNAPESPPPTR
jgi:hypothetical protein